jgi:hypothetical protein
MGTDNSQQSVKTNIPRLRLIIGLMAFAFVIIIALAVYVFTHFSTMEFAQAVIMLAVGVAALIIIMGVVTLLLRGISAGSKTDNRPH